MMPGNASDRQVVICGGGPVALCLALILGRGGVDVEVLEKTSGIAEDLRASTFHPPTLDFLETLDLADEMVAQGLVCPTWQVRLHPSGDRAVFDLSVLERDTKHPYRLQYEQWKLSALLLSRLEAEPTVQITFDAEVTGLTEGDEGVRLAIRTPAGHETRRALYAVGADGARSFVRQSLGLSFEGETYPETTLLATTTFAFEEHLEELSNVAYCWKEDGNFSLLRVPGRWRVSIYPREDVPIEEQLTEDAVQAALQEIVACADGYDVIETRPYRVHQRIVPRYHRGRIALAGDAAHVNAPSGGMGLNGGIHDAFELSEALFDMLQRDAGPERLELYDRRRRPVAREQILQQADRNRRRMRERDPERRREILAELQAVTRDRSRMREHLLRSSMITGLRQAAAVS